MEPAAPSPKLAGDVSEIGGYRILRALVPNQRWLGVAPGGRQVVLKTLDENCLWKGKLHPNIKARIARARDLAHSGVLNLNGVERMSLGRLATRLGAMIESRETETAVPSDRAAARAIRHRAVMGAGATALVGIAIFLGLKQYANARTPKPPTPPQATPAALKNA